MWEKGMCNNNCETTIQKQHITSIQIDVGMAFSYTDKFVLKGFKA